MIPGMTEVLKDSLQPRLAVVFCGTAVGSKSAREQAYYAGVGNAFWKTLHEIGLTPTRFQPAQYREALTLGLGFTDLAKGVSGNDDVLRRNHFNREGLRQKVLHYRPGIVAFTSKRAATEFLQRPVDYGLLDIRVGASRLFVLPSPSGAARRWWCVDDWHALAALVKRPSRVGRSDSGRKTGA